jgi:hypothetical protein
MNIEQFKQLIASKNVDRLTFYKSNLTGIWELWCYPLDNNDPLARAFGNKLIINYDEFTGFHTLDEAYKFVRVDMNCKARIEIDD